jgi:hypothetical protein
MKTIAQNLCKRPAIVPRCPSATIVIERVIEATMLEEITPSRPAENLCPAADELICLLASLKGACYTDRDILLVRALSRKPWHRSMKG